MKKLLIFIFIITHYSCGTTQIIKSADLTTIKIYENLNQSKTDLYITANDWMVDAFGNADSVIQFTDKEAGTIIGKYYLYGNQITSNGIVIDNRLYAKISIQLKENRAKISISPTTDVIIYNKITLFKIRNEIKVVSESFKNRITSTNTNNW